MPENTLVLRGYVLLLAVAERPYFIALDRLAWKVPEGLVLVLTASGAHIHQQLGDGIDTHVRQPGGGALDRSSIIKQMSLLFTTKRHVLDYRRF